MFLIFWKYLINLSIAIFFLLFFLCTCYNTIWNIPQAFPKRRVCWRKASFSFFFYQFISSIFIFIKTPMINFIGLVNVCYSLFNNVITKTIAVLITQFKNTDIKSSKQNINKITQIFRFLFSYHLARAIYRYRV